LAGIRARIGDKRKPVRNRMPSPMDFDSRQPDANQKGVWDARGNSCGSLHCPRRSPRWGQVQMAPFWVKINNLYVVTV